MLGGLGLAKPADFAILNQLSITLNCDEVYAMILVLLTSKLEIYGRQLNIIDGVFGYFQDLASSFIK